MVKKQKAKILLILFLICLIAALIINSSTQILIEKGSAEFESSLSSAVYEALDDELLEQTRFENFFDIFYNNEGDIAFISTDSFKVNALSQALAEKTHKFYDELSADGVGVPIGAFSGIPMLSGVGKEVKIKLINVVSVKCELVLKYEEAGINQTRQTLVLNVTPKVNIVALGKSLAKSKSIGVLVYDNLIVGRVPSTYLNAKVIGEGSLTS